MPYLKKKTHRTVKHICCPFLRIKRAYPYPPLTDDYSNTFISKNKIAEIKSLFCYENLYGYEPIKEVLDEKGINKMLAEQLGKSYNMVNGYAKLQQPRLEILYDIARILDVSVKELLVEQDNKSEK